MARLIDADALKAHFPTLGNFRVDLWHSSTVRMAIDDEPTVDAVPVVHGRWERCGGDLHSSGYAIYCSICHKTHFVHYKYSLGGLHGCKELFEKPKYCPSCGAVMGCEE